jgi:hypothetical protein
MKQVPFVNNLSRTPYVIVIVIAVAVGDAYG